METFGFAVVAFAILGFGLISKRVQHTILTPPMVFVVFGLLVGHAGLGWIDVEVEQIHLLAELTLALVLFTDASRIDMALLRREHDLPVRLLALGLPLTMILGTILAAVMFEALTLWEAAVLAIILAPTDAALGQAVVSNPKVPVRIRQALNVESGLNDGIALPVLLIFISVAAAREAPDGDPLGYWLQFTALQVILGPLVGAAVGYVGSRLMERAWQKGWVNESFLRLSALGLALLSFAAAETVGGNGFISAFVAGLAMGNCARAICPSLYEFGEAEGQLLTLIIFIVFGAAMVPDALDHIDGPAILYGLLSLTVVRMLPAALSLLGKGLRPGTFVFLGWFGPRGIASILYALLVLGESAIAGQEQILAVVTVTVLMSVFAHGVTAYPGASWYGAHAEDMKTVDPDCAEGRPVSEMPLRHPHRPLTAEKV